MARSKKLLSVLVLLVISACGATLTTPSSTTIDPQIADLQQQLEELKTQVNATSIPTTTTTTPATTTTSARPKATDAPTQTTSAPVYIVETKISKVSKVLPNGPWTCMRTYVYSDGYRSSENFKSETECGK